MRTHYKPEKVILNYSLFVLLEHLETLLTCLLVLPEYLETLVTYLFALPEHLEMLVTLTTVIIFYLLNF